MLSLYRGLAFSANGLSFLSEIHRRSVFSSVDSDFEIHKFPVNSDFESTDFIEIGRFH